MFMSTRKECSAAFKRTVEQASQPGVSCARELAIGDNLPTCRKQEVRVRSR